MQELNWEYPPLRRSGDETSRADRRASLRKCRNRMDWRWFRPSKCESADPKAAAMPEHTNHASLTTV